MTQEKAKWLAEESVDFQHAEADKRKHPPQTERHGFVPNNSA